MRLLYIGESPYNPTGQGIVANRIVKAAIEKFEKVYVYAWNYNVLNAVDYSDKLNCEILPSDSKEFGISQKEIDILVGLVIKYQITHVICQGDAIYFSLMYRVKEFLIAKGIKSVVFVAYLNIDGTKVPDKYMFLESFDQVITSSNFAKKELEKVLKFKNEVKVVYHGVDLEKYKFRVKAISDKEPFVIGSIGVAAFRKNLSELVILAKSLKQARIPVQFIILTTQALDLVELINREDVQDIMRVYYQPISEIEVVNFLSQMDLYIQPSYGEGFGLPIVEAMALGVPVIAANNSSMTELVRNKKYLVDCNTVMMFDNTRLYYGAINSNDLFESVKEKIREIRKGKHKAVVEENRKFVEQFDWKDMSRKIVDIVVNTKSIEIELAGVEMFPQIRTSARLSRVVGVRRVAIAKVGGIGDNLQLVPLIKGVRRKYKNNVVIDLYVEKFGEIFGFVDGINDIKMTRFGQPNIVKSLINEYDEVFDVRYVSKAYGKDVKDTEYYKKYAEFYDRWVELNPRLEDLNEHIVNIMIKSLGYEDYCTIDDLKLDRPVAQYKGLEKDSYIVVAPEYGLIKTKQYSSEFWLDLIEKVSEKIKVVIIGKTKDFEIIGYDNIVDMRGKTSLIQVLELINSAKGVIAIEGGIGWVSKFVGKKAIVLFASTPVVCYGFKENINLTNNVCRPCWWSMPEPANCVLGEKYCKNCVSVEVVLSKLKEL